MMYFPNAAKQLASLACLLASTTSAFSTPATTSASSSRSRSRAISWQSQGQSQLQSLQKPSSLILHESISDSNNEGTESTVTPTATTSTTTKIRSVPIFDFGNSAQNTTAKFERIDDVIMGGISSSTLRQVDNEDYARWSGVCRTDGGGFCGVRTLPFKETLDVNGTAGLYIKCRLSSDEEADRRVWKITTRTEKSRGELLYQAMFTFPKHQQSADSDSSSDGDNGDWRTIRVPFEDFKLVKGARLMPNATGLDNSGGLYQIGMTMSKFIMSSEMKAMDDFRPGYFELQIQQLGLYASSSTTEIVPAPTPNLQEDNPAVQSMTKKEALAQRPLLLKVLLPLSKLFFTEQSQRRKSAMRLLREKRGLSRWQAIRFGMQWRAKQVGIFRSVGKSLAILVSDCLRQVTKTVLRFTLVLPLKFVGKAIGCVVGLFKKKPASSSETALR